MNEHNLVIISRVRKLEVVEMKKILSLILSIIVSFNLVGAFAESTKTITVSDLEQRGMTSVESLSDGITPIYVENLEELDTLLNKIDQEISRDIVLSTPNDTEKSAIIVNDDMSMLKSARPPKYYNKNTTIFDLNDIGGKIVQNVKYYKHYDEPGMTYLTLDTSSVFEDGIWGMQEITYNIEDAILSSDGQKINCRVEGNTRVYIGIAGQGINLKTFPFDKSYTLK